MILLRRKKINEILDGLKEGYSGFNTMQILLVHLQRAALEERPLIAAILLQLDLMVNPLLVFMHPSHRNGCLKFQLFSTFGNQNVHISKSIFALDF